MSELDLSRSSSNPLYRAWNNIKWRCLNPKATSWACYGGRGIKVCERWVDSFESFASDMGSRPDGCSIDRINGDGNYEPGNCRWATQREQTANTRFRRGSKHQNSKLNEDSVFAMLRTFDTGAFTVSQISKWWGVHYMTASDIVHRRAWQHVH